MLSWVGVGHKAGIGHKSRMAVTWPFPEHGGPEQLHNMQLTRPLGCLLSSRQSHAFYPHRTSLGQHAKSGRSLQALAVEACVRVVGKEHMNVFPSARPCTFSCCSVWTFKVPSFPGDNAGLHLGLQTVSCKLVQSTASPSCLRV